MNIISERGTMILIWNSLKFEFDKVEFSATHSRI